MKFAIINGVNLSNIGIRQTSIYGTKNWIDYEAELHDKFPGLLWFLQTDVEGEIIEHIQKAAKDCNGIIINPGAYTHTSVAIADAIRAIEIPAVEVHISSVMTREPYRRRSHISEVCTASLSGMGLYGYESAVLFLMEIV